MTHYKCPNVANIALKYPQKLHSHHHAAHRKQLVYTTNNTLQQIVQRQEDHEVRLFLEAQKTWDYLECLYTEHNLNLEVG